MAERALIIAIQNYNDAKGGFTAKELKGTLDAALRFREWLEEKWKAEGKTGSILFCSEPPIAGQSGATSDEIIDALIRLQNQGRNSTDNLYVYFSGHGFRLAGDPMTRADVLVTSDFKDVQRSTASCFRLDALIEGFRSSLGHGCHFYFIDACRNEVHKAIASNITPFTELGDEEPSVFVLQSTVSGDPALVGGPFAKLLLEGLRGAGIAKVWEPPAKTYMKVRFDSLRKYLKERLQNVQPITQSSSGETGESEAVLATITPVPQIELTITIKTTLTSLRGNMTVTAFGAKSGTMYPITERTFVRSFEPNYYAVALDMGQLEVSPAGEIDVELYENRELTFQISTGPDGGGADDLFRGSVPPSNLTNVHLEVPRGTEVVLRHLGTGIENLFDSSKRALLPIGDYTADLRFPGGPVIRHHEIRVVADQEIAIAPARWRGSPVHESIAKMFPQDDGGVDFSESLQGAITDPDLSLWLAILGGGRIIGTRGDYSKIGPLPLADFSSEPPGASPVYVLAGLPDSKLDLRVGLSEGRAKPKWLRAREPQSMEGLREAVMHPPPGQFFMTLIVGSQPAYTVASFASPNRCTLIALTLDEDDTPLVAQYLLPLGHLVQNLDPEVQDRIRERNQLKDVQVLAQLSRAFRKRRGTGTEFNRNEIDQLFNSKWLDPVAASMATYESLRRGQREHLMEVAANMSHFFPNLPDTSAIIRLSGTGNPAPHGTPLFLDGLRAFPKYDEWLPYPAGLLDFTGPWTAWRGAVSGNSGEKLDTYRLSPGRFLRSPRFSRRKAK